MSNFFEVSAPGVVFFRVKDCFFICLFLNFHCFLAWFQLVEKVYESCGRNLDSAIKSLTDLRLSSCELINPCENGGHSASSGAPSSSASVAAVTEGDSTFKRFFGLLLLSSS